MENLKCPFCGGDVHIVVCDDEGNYPKSKEYEKDPYSGLGYILCHNKNDTNGKICPIAGFPNEDMLGINIYDTREEAIGAWIKYTLR